MAGGDEHTGVLSGAVAVDGCPGDAGDLQGVLGGDIHGVFRPAAQLIRGETCLAQDALHGLYMKGLSVVGGTDDGQFLRGNAIMLQRTAFCHGDRLKGLGGGAGKRKTLRITELPKDPACVIRYRDMSPVDLIPPDHRGIDRQ